MTRKLGHASQYILDALRRRGPSTVEELALYSGRSEDSVRDVVHRLNTYGGLIWRCEKGSWGEGRYTAAVWAARDNRHLPSSRGGS